MALVTLNLSQNARSSGWDPDDPHDALWQRFATGYHYTVLADGTQHDSRLGSDPATGGSANTFLSAAGSLDLAPTNFPVSVSLDWLDDSTARIALDGAWNSIKNIQIADFSGHVLILENWVDVWVTLDREVDQVIRVDGAKRAEITTGSGNDIVWVGVDSNNNDWTNLIKVSTGAGNDVITVTDASRDYSGSAFRAAYDPAWTHTVILAGDGNDVIIGSRSTDVIDGGSGLDTVILHGPRDAYDVIRTDSVVLVIDHRTGAANLDGTDVLTGVEVVQFDDQVMTFFGAAAAAPAADLHLFG